MFTNLAVSTGRDLDILRLSTQLTARGRKRHTSKGEAMPPSAVEKINVGARVMAAMLDISPRTLATLTDENVIPSFKLKGRRLYNVEEVKKRCAELSQGNAQ